jgi:hypothetical protein
LNRTACFSKNKDRKTEKKKEASTLNAFAVQVQRRELEHGGGNRCRAKRCAAQHEQYRNKWKNIDDIRSKRRITSSVFRAKRKKSFFFFFFFPFSGFPLFFIIVQLDFNSCRQ